MTQESNDWVGRPRSYILAWGLPTAILIAAIFLDPATRTILWTLALIWKGAACLANARRCGRTHCFYTGPFYLVLAGLVVLHGTGNPSFGPNGWLWLGGAIAVGTVAIWPLTEKLLGSYRRRGINTQ